jgi:hypothetical protein
MGKYLKLSDKITTAYENEVRGFGEVYEILSVEATRKRLWHKYCKEYPDSILYLEPRNHKTFALEHRENNNLNDIILDAGETDRPFWGSNPKIGGKPPTGLRYWLGYCVCKIFVSLEPLNIWSNHGHINYILLKRMI